MEYNDYLEQTEGKLYKALWQAIEERRWYEARQIAATMKELSLV